MKEVTIIATVYDFDQNAREALAVTEHGIDIRIDPFVTSDWIWEERHNHLGRHEFYGFWSRGVFLPLKVKDAR